MFFAVRLMYLCILYVFIFLAGCTGQDSNTNKKSDFEYLLNQSTKDSDLFALDSLKNLTEDSKQNLMGNDAKYSAYQVLDIISLSQKINLFSKCYYYSDKDICDKILQGFQEECESGFQGFSCALAGMSIIDNKNSSNTNGRVTLLRYFIDGCKLKDSLSCMFLRKYYADYGYEQEAQRLLDSVTNLCHKGGAFECFLLSNLYENSNSFSAYKKYIQEYRIMACKQNLAIACGYLDSISLQKADYENYQKKACSLGMLVACDAVSELNELDIRNRHSRIFKIW